MNRALHIYPTLKSSMPLTNFVATTNNLLNVFKYSSVLMVNELFSGNTRTGYENLCRVEPRKATFNWYTQSITVE